MSVLLCCCGVQIEEAKRQKEEAKAHLDELEQQLAMYAAPYKLQSAVYSVAEGGRHSVAVSVWLWVWLCRERSLCGELQGATAEAEEKHRAAQKEKEELQLRLIQQEERHERAVVRMQRMLESGTVPLWSVASGGAAHGPLCTEC